MLKLFAINISILNMALLLTSNAMAQQPNKDTCKSNQSFTGYITGYAEGSDYSSTKISAIADAISFFGMELKATGELNENSSSSDSVYLSNNITTNINSITKGAEVLSNCEMEGKFKITAGIRKTTITALLDNAATYRNNWLTNTVSTIKKLGKKISNPTLVSYRNSYKKLVADEKKDVEAWLLLQRPKELFKSIPDDLKQEFVFSTESKNKKSDKYLVKADSPTAKQTLPAFLNKLHELGYNAELYGTESDVSLPVITWSCSLSEGSPVGNTVRFSAECAVRESEIGIDKISVSGIANIDSVEKIAVTKISEELKNILAH